MKLLLCRACQDVIRLIQEEKRICQCGLVGGKYVDELNAIYFGEAAVPIGFANSTLVNAIQNQPNDGMGENFKAFVIPKICPTYTLVTREKLEDKLSVKSKFEEEIKNATKMRQITCPHNNGFVSNTRGTGSRCVMCGYEKY